ncbi:MAG: Ig-like domain-containing protein [Candidatus Thiodiazotropha endolucinida]
MRRRRSKKRSNALICEELEPRILLSADLVGVAVDPASSDVEQQVDETELQTIEAGLQSVLSNQTGESDISTRELVIIDPATPDYQSLVDDLISRDGDGRSFEIVLLDSSANGIEQLNETLAQYQGLNAIHLISHGGEGEIRLGDATLNQDGLQQSAEQISAWGEALNPGGDWLIYGCDIASTATGERFIEQFAALTGADVAASNDVTGHETLGGDWDLEVVEGSIETDVAVGNDGQEAWLNRLDTTTGLLGHWTLDSNAADSSGNSHDGTLTNGASIDNPGSSNPIGDGNLNLDGFNDFVQLNTHVSAFSDLSEGTIAAWINTSYSGAQAMFSITDTADYNSLVVFGMDNGRIFFDLANNNFYSLSVETNASYADGNWHHVAVTVDGSGNSIYIDGVEVSLAGLFYRDGNSSTSSFISSVTSLDSMAIGNLRDPAGYTGFFNGLQDDVRVYDRALSASDITELISNTAPTYDAAGPPSFTAHTITSAANGAASVTTVDMDGDGDLDVVSASQNDNKIAWYENDGSQNFTAQTISTSASGAFAVTTADVDGDGDMDVLSASITDDKIAWYENDGNENFTAHTITLSADIAASVAAADVDDDGDIDVLSASVGDDRVVWYENDGNENFTTRTITSSAVGASFVTTVDLDEDGDLDVLSTSTFDNRVAWYENDGNENFTTHTVTTSATEARQVIAADVDGDGDLDLLSASRSSDKLAWYENDGFENFTLHTITAAAGPVSAVAAADIDGDGDLDVISASYTDDNVVWFENDGSENFTANTIASVTGEAFSVAVADMDGDGDVDVLATDDAADAVTWYENVMSVTTLDGAPTFVEDGAAVVLDADVNVSDAELDALNSGQGDYNGASLTLVRNGAANSDDVFSFNDGNGITLSGSNLIKSSQIIASFDTTSTAGELVITFTNANSQTPTSADVDNILRQITYSNSNDAPPAGVQIDWTFDDGNTGSQGSGGALQAVGSTTVTITAVNDDPTNAGSLPTDITVAENVSSNVDLSAVDFSDVDAGVGTLTVTLTTSTGGNLSAAAGTGITIGGTSTARTLTDLNNYFNTASNITYLHGTPDTNGNDADTINVTINDNGNTGTGGGTNINLGTVNVDITPDNEVPTIANLGGDSLAYNEDDGAQVIDQGTASVVADVDSSDFDTGTLTVSFQAGSDNAEDVLAIRDQGAGPTNITVSGSAVSYGGTQIGTFTGGSGGANLVITLDADADATAVTALVRNITYENTDTENPTTGARTVRFVLTDGDGGTSVDYDTTVTVSTVNDAPTLAATAANDTLTENTDTTSGAVFATVTIDPIEAGDDIASAQLTLGGGIDNSDTLTINGTAISGLGSNSSGAITGGHSYSYTQATGVVTITFAASTNAAAAELVLESITYGIDPADQNPSTTARTVTLNTVTDNGGGSDTSSDIGETATISVGAVNDNPTNAGSLPSDISVTEDVSSNIDLSAIDFADVDAASGTLTVTLTTSTGGDLSAAAGTGITIGGTSTALTLTGTLSDLNNYFNTASNITYLHGTANTNGNDADTINVTINDNGNTGSGGGTNINLGTVNVDIAAVNDDPSNAGSLPSDISVTEDVSSNVDLSAVDFADVDAASGTLTVTLTTSTGGDLTAAAGSGITIGGTSTARTLTGTLTDLNNYFNTASNITYLHGTTNTAGNDADTINVTINDNGNTGTGGGTNINMGTVNVDITAVNDPPTLAATAANDTLTENTDTTSGAVFATVTIDPIEAGDDIASAQLTLGGGIDNSDTLTINGTAISGLGSNSSGAITGGHSYSYTQATGVVTITFAASTNAAAAELVLESITYGIDPADQNPSTTARTVTLNTVTDNGGGSDTSSDIGETATISVGAVNDDPSNAGSLPSDISVTEDVPSNIDLSAIDFSDIDAGAGTLTVTLTTSTGGDLSAAAGTGITIGGTSTALTLTGTLTDLNNYFNTASNITYLHGTTNTAGNDADTINVTINDNGNTGTGGGGAINLGTVNVDITAVNDAPVVIDLDGDIHNFTEGDGVVLIEQGGDAVVSDSDSSDYAGGSLTVEVDSGLQSAEDRFSIFNQGTDTGEIGLSGGNVTYSGTLIGTVTGGTGIDPLTVTFNSNATSAAVTALVRNITYENSNLENPTDGTRSVTIDISDGDGGTSLTQNLTLNVSSVNDAPVVDLNGADGAGEDFAATFTEGGGAVNVVDTDATISDVDNTTYQNLSINLSGFLDGVSEQITIAGYVFTYGTSDNQIRTVGSTDFEIDFDGTGFNVMLDGGGGMPEADLQSLLRGVTYENTSQDPTAGDRTINFFAQDSSLLNSPVATSTITVNPQNDAPTATDNANSVSENGFVSGNVITDDSGSGVDSDPEGDGLQVTQVEGGAYTPGLPVTLASGAQVTFQSNGSYTYNTNGQFDGLGAGSSVDDNFTYQIGDGNGGFDTATVTITINGSNNAPVITSAGLTLDEGQTVTLGVANFAVSDADDTDFTYTVSGISGGYFQLSTNPGVSITSFTSANLTGGLVQFVDDGNEVAPAFSVTVNDGDIDSNTLAATINFTLVSDSTPVANIDSITVAEGGTVTTLVGGASTVLNNDTGLVDAPVTVSLVSDVTNGSLTLNGDGTFSYTHDGSENFTDSFTYRITDNDGQTADATVTINVTPVSDATPVANADSITVAEGATATTLVGGSSTVLNNDTGLGDTPVTVTLVTDVTNGTLTLNTDGTFSYTHDGSENFTDSFTYRVTDNDGETADATVTINITPVSDATPVANADSITVAEGGTVTTLVGGASTVLNNDTGLGDTPVTVSLVTDVTNGSLTLNGDGTFSYTHDGSENFTDSFTYRVTDNDGQTADATVTINITPVSDATPVANADSITVAEGATATTLVGGASTVLNNDTGLGDTPVTVSLVTDVTNGSLTLNGDGTFSYTHDGSENFTDSFTYRITDNDGQTADATVTINVTPVSDATPVANADSITVAEGTTATTLVGGSSTVLDNDTGLGDTPVTVSLVTDVTNGSLTLNGDGTFSYTHDGSENFTDSFTYRVTDNDGETADATVTINVTPVSDETPVANADSITVAEGATATTLVGGSSTVLNNDTGLGDTPVTVSLVTDVTNGTLTLNGDGTFSYTHDGSENFTDSFTYRVTDNDGQTADATVTINVTPVSDTTPVANADSITVAEGATATTLVGGSSTVLNNDTGLGDTPVTVSLVIDVTNGSLILNGDGTFSYTHDGSENFTDSFTYRVTDNDGETADATVTINITPVSDATPVANADSITVAEGATATTLVGGSSTVLNNDTGLGDTPVTVSLVTDVTNGTLTLNGDGTFSYTHDGSENFTDSFTYRVTDNDGETADATVTINVTPVSDTTPVANADSITVAEGATATTLVGGSSTVLNNDTGLGDTPVIVSLITNVTNGSLTLNGDGTFSYTHDGSENFTDSFTYRITDNDGETADATVTINVTPVSDTTPVANADSITVAEGATATTLVGGASTVLNNDTGLGDSPVIVSLITDVTNGSLTLNGDGTFSYTHDGSENFTDSFTYRVTDNDGETADATVTINVTPVSDETPVANTDSITVAEGATATTLVGGSSTVLNNDTGLGDTPVIVSLITNVTNGSLTLNGDGTFSYTHDGSENFTDSFTYRITDNDGETADATVTINITPVSDQTPVANADSITVAEGATATTLVGGSSTVLNNDTGLSDTPVTVSLITDVTNGILTLNSDGTFSYTHDGSENFTDSFTYRVTDNDGETADATVTINVISNNNPPEASDTNISVLEDNVYTGNLPAAVDGDGDTVTYRLDSNPVHGSITLDMDGGFSYTPDADYHGADSFIYSVSDGNGGNNSYLVEIDVVSVNDSPVITSHDENENVLLSLEENATLVTMVTADDPENDAISFAIDGGADLGLFSIDPISGEMVFTHAPDMENPLDADQDNLYQVQVLVSDGNGGTDRQSFTIEVTDVDEFDVGLLIDVEDTPDAIPLSGSLSDGVGITVWAEDPDSSNNRITYSLDDDSNGLFAIDPASGTITLASTLDNRDVSQFEITVRATSEDGSYSLHTFHIAFNRAIDTTPEPEPPYLDEIIFDLDPEEPVESQVTTGPSQQPPTDADTVSEELSSEDQEASLSTGIEERTRVIIEDIERPAIKRLSPSLFPEDSRNSYRYDYYQARLTPLPVAPEELPVFDTSIGELIEVPEAIWHLLDSMNSEMSEHQREQVSTDRITVQTATFGTLALSAGYVAWLLRAGVLSASLLSFTPLWRQIDPLPVLSAHAKRRDEDQDHPPEEDPDEKRLAKLFDRKKKPRKNRFIFFRKDS